MLYFFLLGGSFLIHVPIYLAWIHIGLIISTSLIIYTQAYVAMYLFNKAISESQFFFIAALFFVSILPTLQLFIRRFQASINDVELFTYVRIFSFLYILIILLFSCSLIIVNVRYQRSTLLFFLLVSISVWVARAGTISYSKAISVFDVFIGGKWVLVGSGLSLCIIGAIIYLIDLLTLKVRPPLIVGRIIYLSGFLSTLHILLVFPLGNIFIIFITVIVMSICLLGYLRNIFIHAF